MKPEYDKRLSNVAFEFNVRRYNLDDETVPQGSIVPTFAAMALFIDNARWVGPAHIPISFSKLRLARWR